METTQKSMAFVPAPIATALAQISTKWHGHTSLQKKFIEAYFNPLVAYAEVLKPYSRACANFDVDAVNGFLAAEGFNIRLQEGAPTDLYVAGVFRALVKWFVKGYTETITGPDRQIYQGAIIEKGVSFWGSAENPLVRLQTKDKNVTMLMRMEDAPIDPYVLCELPTNATTRVHNYSRVLFPKINLNLETDVTWSLGMTAVPRGRVSQAVQQDKLRLNHEGAAAESAYAAAVSLGVSDVEEPAPLLVINRPFRLWVVVKGLPFAPAGYWLGTDCWQDPGDIDF